MKQRCEMQNVNVDGPLCTYCDEIGDSKDHVPPKLLFPKPRSEMITVPACLRCNQKFARDDEYAHLVISLDRRAGSHGAIKRHLPKVLKSLQRKESDGFKGLVLNTFKEVYLQEDNGLYVPSGSFTVDLIRLKSWSCRITRGLYRYETKKRLPLNATMLSVWEEDVSLLPFKYREQLMKIVNQVARDSDEHAMQEDIFRYRLKFLREDQSAGVIIKTFYNNLHVMSLFHSEGSSVGKE